MPVVNYTNDHNAALAEFVASHSSSNSELYDLCFSTFQGVLGQPGLAPTDNCFVLEHACEAKGLALVFREFAISRSVIEVMTAPELAGSLDEQELVKRAVARAEAEGLGVAHICVLPESGRGELLEQVGFSQVRTYLDMLWVQDELPDLELPQGYSVRSFQPGDTPLLTRVQNDAFTGSWGFSPNTEEQIEYRAHMPNTSESGILFLFEGDRPAGHCWTVMVPSDNGVRGVIGMIGVVPEYRGKGVSRHILHAGMKYLRSTGLSEIGLEVDGNNGPAVGLYKSTGFKTIGERHWFERVLPGT
ncbi:MAG TPA: GNAT family N-acetyltransferase [Dehalococcoidia bacterium]|nr:GNAT family N-acetyltransferase [Dehalococcoidia bacterium]HIN23754.1 GNAT family N-acetyltransferase [Dehalococcoidia bacterium]